MVTAATASLAFIDGSSGFAREGTRRTQVGCSTYRECRDGRPTSDKVCVAPTSLVVVVPATCNQFALRMTPPFYLMATRLEIGRRLLLLLLLFLGVQHAGPDGCAARRNFLTSDLVIGRRDCDNRKPQRPKPAPPTRRTGAQSLFPPIPLTVRIRLAAWRDHRQNEKRPGTTPSRSLRWSGWDTMASARSSHSQSL